MESKKILSNLDESKLFNTICELLIQKRCTLRDFEALSERIHEFYKNNATLGESIIAIDKNIAHQSRYQQSSTND